ncbi:MAG: hypothetical protein JJT82_04110 [Legionellaceae bacterium]|nr:hypothetical protein [Legionellaceae bacterium]
MRRYLDAKWLCLMGCNLLLVLLVCVQKPSVYPQLQNVSSLESRLDAIESKLNQPAIAPDLSPINHHLQELGQFIQQLNNKDDHQLGELFSTGQVALKKQLDGISDLLNTLDAQKHPVKTLPANALPFQVLSIDSIQEVSVASVAYDYKTQALELGDSLAGWTVVQLDFSNQLIVFENHDQAHVTLHMNAHGVAHG